VSEPWQLQLYRRSLKKKATVKAMLDHLPRVEGRRCLELGCGTGLTSHFLRQRGGTWTSADFERDHVRSARGLVRDRVLQIDDRSLPFRSEAFDLVAAINFLEHIKDDGRFFAEMAELAGDVGAKHLMADHPELVAEVSFDHTSGRRIRHGASFKRWRDDKPPRECTIDQLDS